MAPNHPAPGLPSGIFRCLSTAIAMVITSNKAAGLKKIPRIKNNEQKNSANPTINPQNTGKKFIPTTDMSLPSSVHNSGLPLSFAARERTSS